MKNLTFAILGLIVVAMGVAIALLLSERGELSKARNENLALHDQVQGLTAQRESVPSRANDREVGVPAKDKEFPELLRLRGEVGRLRRELDERGHGSSNAAQVAVVSNAVTAPALLAFGAELRDLGAATPERAASSLIWAALQGDRARVGELLELPAGVSADDAPQHYGFFTSQLSNNFSHMEFTSIQSVRLNPDGTLRLNQVYRDAVTAEEHRFPFMLRLHGSV